MMSVGTKKAIFLTICILLILALLVGVVVTFLSRGRRTISVDDIGKYDATKEIEEALENLSKEDTRAKVLRKVNTKAKVVALTFQGLSDSVTNEKILELLIRYKYKANFFHSGNSCSRELRFRKEIT